MKSFALISTIVLAICATALSQTPGPEVGKFELNPAAPPSPALKYQLVFEDSSDLRPGNGAILYLDSVLLMGPDAKDKATKALEAYDTRDMARFNSLADSLENPSMLKELDLAGRRENCDWQPPVREEGFGVLLPHLSPIRDIGRILKVRALREIGQGKIDDALKTLRLGYELSDNLGKEPFFIDCLVSINITTMMNDCLREIMNRPDAPNLYWALSTFPNCRTMLSRSMDSEGTQWLIASGVNLSDLRAGIDLSPDRWHAFFDYVGTAVSDTFKNASYPSFPDAVRDASPDVIRQAQAQYAESHHLTPEEAAKVDPIVSIGAFYFHQFDVACDELHKLRGQPYPILLAKSGEYQAMVAKLQHDEPRNLLLEALSTIPRLIWKVGSVDRQFAALTAVEAIRSYAAANDGKLPARLEDISDTPVPDNPVTGLAFDYGVDGDVATLSDSQSQTTLRYTIRIRK